MPHKGLFTQGAMVLTEQPADAEAVERALGAFDGVKRSPADGEKNWISGYPTWLIPYRREVNGVVTVEVVGAPWPDDMGDPRSPDKNRQMLFGAWSMGFMGPFTWPDNLARATQFAEAFGRGVAAEAAKRHSAFVRVRSSYAMGGDENARIIPDGYDARAELDFVTSVAQALTRLPGALCYFNPGGETLYTPEGLDEALRELRQKGLPPLPVWAESRLMRLEDAPPWVAADIVGMGQLDVDDQEACFRRGKHDPGDVLDFLRNITFYVLANGPVIKDGHTTEGPGGVWRAMQVEEALLPASRPALRWLPEDGSEPPAALRQRTRSKLAQERPGLLGRLKSMFGRGAS